MYVSEAKLLRQLSGSEPLRLLLRRSSRVIAPPPSQVTPDHTHTGALVFQLVREVHESPPNALYTHISETDGGTVVGSAVGAAVTGSLFLQKHRHIFSSNSQILQLTAIAGLSSL